MGRLEFVRAMDRERVARPMERVAKGEDPVAAAHMIDVLDEREESHPSAGAPATTVLHVITTLDVGGAERMLVSLATGSTPGPVTHRVVSLTPGGYFVPVLRGAGVAVTELRLGPRSGRPLASASAMILRSGVMPPQIVASTRTALQQSSRIACSIVWVIGFST